MTRKWLSEFSDWGKLMDWLAENKIENRTKTVEDIWRAYQARLERSRVLDLDYLLKVVTKKSSAISLSIRRYNAEAKKAIQDKGG